MIKGDNLYTPSETIVYSTHMALAPKKTTTKPLYSQRTTLLEGWKAMKKGMKDAKPLALPKKKK